MIAFPTMLVAAAAQANLSVPEDPDDFDAFQFPHFYVFCACQLGRPMTHGAHWDNAKIIAEIPDDKIKAITFEELMELGWQI